MENTIFWEKYTSSDLSENLTEKTVVVIPVGSCEQHGKHLPLETDTSIGYNILKNAAKQTKNKVLLIPPIWAGYSPHHMDFCGSITLERETLFKIIIDISKSINKYNIDKIVIFNSHGGNKAILKTAVDELGSKYDIFPFLLTYYDLISDEIKSISSAGPGGMGHAGELETSLQLFLSESLINKESIEGGIVNGSEYFQPAMYVSNKISIYRPFSKYSNIGVLGEPNSASKEKGKVIFNLIVKKVVTLLDDIAEEKALPYWQS